MKSHLWPDDSTDWNQTDVKKKAINFIFWEDLTFLYHHAISDSMVKKKQRGKLMLMLLCWDKCTDCSLPENPCLLNNAVRESFEATGNKITSTIKWSCWLHGKETRAVTLVYFSLVLKTSVVAKHVLGDAKRLEVFPKLMIIFASGLNVMTWFLYWRACSLNLHHDKQFVS